MKAKTRLILSKITFVLFILFWQVETWFFIIRDGWHWKAISESEKTCDGIASFLLTVSIALLFSIVYEVVDLYVHIKEDE